MANFQTFSQGRLFVHILSTQQFQTRHISIKLARPMVREAVTSTAVLPYLWMEGTREFPSALAIVNRADDLFGAVLRTGIGKRGNLHVVEAYGGVPEESGLEGASGLFERVQELVLQLVTDPLTENNAFPKASVDREKALHRKRIESIYDDKIAYAMERCMEELGKGEASGLARLGYLEDVDRLSPDELWKVQQRLLGEADIHVYMVGNISDPKAASDRVFEQLQSKLGSTSTRGQEAFTVSPLAYRTGEVRRVEEMQEVNQGKLNLAFRTHVAYQDPVYPALLVANGVLGGFPHSKLFINVREKASLAYYASSRLDGLTGVLAIQTGIDPANYEKALSIVLDQVKVIQQGNVSEEELAFTKNGIRNQYLQALDQPMSIADVHFSGVLTGVNREIPDLLKQIESVQKDDVVQAAQTLKEDTVYFLGNREVTTHG